MASDVKLDGDWIDVEGNWTRLRTLDLMLDAQQRRIAQGGKRRALVHDQGDRLTVNYAGDYPNGVRINGTTSVESLYVDGRGRFSGGVVAPTILLGDPAPKPMVVPGAPPPGGGEYGLDVGQAIEQLEQEIAALKDRVATLEAQRP